MVQPWCTRGAGRGARGSGARRGAARGAKRGADVVQTWRALGGARRGAARGEAVVHRWCKQWCARGAFQGEMAERGRPFKGISGQSRGETRRPSQGTYGFLAQACLRPLDRGFEQVQP